MKTKLSILLVSLALVTMQACDQKAEKNEQSTDAVSVDATQKSLMAAERQAKLEQDRLELEQKRMIALEELMKIGPYYTLSDGKLVFYKVETAPAYVGGNEAMIKFLKDNLRYPEDAKKAELEGTVFVDFIVSADGSIRNTEVTSYTYEKVNQAFTDEAIRVVKMMPPWSPGLQNGKPVDVKYSIPITFQIN